MKEDRFKYQLRNNRKQFEQAGPSVQVWQNLKGKLKTHTQKPSMMMRYRFQLGIAAVFILIIGTWLFFKSYKTAPVITASYQQALQYHTGQIDLQKKKLEQVMVADPELETGLKAGTDELKTAYQELEKKLATGINRQDVLQMMINNLKMQELILNNQLMLIQTMKQENNGIL